MVPATRLFQHGVLVISVQKVTLSNSLISLQELGGARDCRKFWGLAVTRAFSGLSLTWGTAWAGS